MLNLDTGERVPLSIAEDKLPQCINPLSLHIMRLTSEYVSSSSLNKGKESDDESVDSKQSFAQIEEPGRVSPPNMSRSMNKSSIFQTELNIMLFKITFHIMHIGPLTTLKRLLTTNFSPICTKKDVANLGRQKE